MNILKIDKIACAAVLLSFDYLLHRLTKIEYFSKPKTLGENRNVDTDLSNHMTKADLKNATCVSTSRFTNKLTADNFRMRLA